MTTDHDSLHDSEQLTQQPAERPAEQRAEEAPRDDVRTVRRPPVAGPHYRNLAFAALALLILIAVAVLLAPMKPKSSKPEAAPTTAAEKTFLDSPPQQSEDETTLDPRRPWWKQLTRSHQAAEGEPEAPAEDHYIAWPNEPSAVVSADPLPVPPDARQQALERALRSSRLRKADEAPQLPGRTPAAAAMDPMLAAASSILPTPDQVAKMLAGATGQAQGVGQAQGPAPTTAALDPSGVGQAEGLSPSLGAFDPIVGAAPRGRPGETTRAVLAAYEALPISAGGPRVLRAGTLIPARLETAIDSDAPGPVTARVLRDVLDSATGRQVLIPAGALLLGSVGSQLAYGQDRALVAFERLVLPTGSYELPGFEALETSGTRGLADQVNRHVWPNLGRAVLLAALGAGFELGQPDRGATERLRPGELVASRMALELDRVAAEVLSRGLGRPPTVRIRAGERFVVYLNRDLGL